MKTIPVYSFHPQTAEFCGPTIAHESPLESGVYHHPAFSTTSEPPAYGQLEVAVWGGNEWTVKPDWRGVPLYRMADAQQMEIFEIGQLPASIGATHIEPPNLKDGYELKWGGGFWELEKLPEPYIEPVVFPPKELTPLQYLDLFTDSEQLSVVSATLENAQVKLWYDRMLAAQFITLADTRTEAGLDALVAAGLISAERKAEIFEAMK